MKILSVEQIREADAYTIKHEPIKSIELMERAANTCVEHIKHQYPKGQSFSVFCGKGNNGGDGLAIARLLHKGGYKVEVFELNHTQKASDDYNSNKRLLKALPISITEVSLVSDIGEIEPKTVIIDAILGSGLTRPLEGLLASVVNAINHTTNKVIAIDIPTGLFGEDNSKNNFSRVIRAKETLTFQFPKLSFLFPDSGVFVGDFQVLDIGIHPKYISQTKTKYSFTERGNIINLLKKRDKFSHKGTYGHALLVAGSYGKMGAAVLSAEAVLRAGAGLLTVHIPSCGYSIMQTALPEAMVEVDDTEKEITAIIFNKDFDVIGIGPGIGANDTTVKAFEDLLKQAKNPMVIDADALNILAQHQELLKLVPKNSILTPHPKEFERLVGKASKGFEQLDLQLAFAKKHNVYLILKGTYTAVATPNELVYFNSTGTAGMATAGSGDVLTGILTGLLAQRYTSQEAAILGVYLHGLAGELALDTMGEEAMIASDIIGNIGNAFLEIKKATE